MMPNKIYWFLKGSKAVNEIARNEFCVYHNDWGEFALQFILMLMHLFVITLFSTQYEVWYFKIVRRVVEIKNHSQIYLRIKLTLKKC